LKIRIIFIIIFLLPALLLQNNYAAGIELTNIGSRATALGGNYRSIANDWSAMYWNPAGLAFMEGWSVGMSLEYVMLRPEFKAGASQYYILNGGADFRPFSATYQTTRGGEPLNFLVPSFGVSYSDGNWAYGLGLWVSMGLGTKWDLLDTSGSKTGNGGYNAAYPKFEYENYMQVIDLHPTVSYKINDQLSAGIGISILFGKVEIRRPAYLQNPYLYDESLYNTLLTISDETQTETLNQMRLSPFDHLINEVEMAGSGTTIGGNLGLMFRPTKNLSIGAAIQLNKEMEISGDYKQTAYFGDNLDYQALAEYYDERIFSHLVEGGLLDEQNYLIISQFYSGQVMPLEDTKAKAKIPLPMKVGIGFSYSGFENLILAADINYMEWSDWDILYVTDVNDVRISELVQKWNNTVKIGIGAEYISNLATFRLGVSTENHAPIDDTISPSIPEIGRRYNLDIGVSFSLWGGTLSLNYEKIFIAEHQIEDWVYDQMTIALNMAGTYSMNVNTMMLGYDYKF
jgi:long-chain fatty acid transport protein